jgi:hypothetical protein
MLRPLTNTTQFPFHLHTVCVASFDQHNTIPISSYTLFVLRPLTNTIPVSSTHCLCCVLFPKQHNSNFIYTLLLLRSLTNTTQFQYHLHTVSVASFDQHNTIPVLSTHCLCCIVWPTQHNSNFILHNICVSSFDLHNTIPISSYTVFVLRPLANTTQFQFHLHTGSVASFDQHNTIPISSTHCMCCVLWPAQHNSNFIYTLFVLRPLTNTTQFQFHLTHCLCCVPWPIQRNSNLFIHTVCVASFNQHNTISISSYTMFVLRPLTNTTQFQYHLHTVSVAPFDQHNTIPSSCTHCLFCALWPTQHNSNFIYTLFVLRPLTKTTQFQFHLHSVGVASFDQHNTIPIYLHIVFVASFDQYNTIPISSTHCVALFNQKAQFQFQLTQYLFCLSTNCNQYVCVTNLVLCFYESYRSYKNLCRCKCAVFI